MLTSKERSELRAQANSLETTLMVGKNGFGYDPIFYYPPMGMSTAEMTPEDKNQVSHRGNALRVFYDKLKEAGYADK